MIAFLIACAPFIPTILSIVSLLMRMFGGSESDLKAYESMVQKMNADGRLSLESHDRLIAHKDAIMQRLKDKENASAIKPPEADKK